MSAVWDRDKALAVIEKRWRGHSTQAQMLDALEACVTPAPAHTIDRDALVHYLNHDVPLDEDMGVIADQILALLRPDEKARERERDAIDGWYREEQRGDRLQAQVDRVLSLCDALDATSRAGGHLARASANSVRSALEGVS